MNCITLRGRTTLQVLGCFALLLAFAVVANAQTFQTANTTVTLFAGSQDTTTFGFSGVTQPYPGLILQGTAISAFTGKPVRHLWYGDPLNGFCRLDPEIDSNLAPVAGQGAYTPNIGSCLATILVKGVTPGQATYDATTGFIYSEDVSRTNAGVFRLEYLPSGDNGQGSVNIIAVTSLLGTQSGRNAFGGCPQLKDPKTGSPVPQVPDAIALGPDGNLYSGSIRDGAIIRVISPATFNTDTDCLASGDTGQDPTKKLQIPMASSDEKFGSGHTFGLGFVGSTLFGADNIAPWVKFNATQCLTPINGNTACANPLFGGAALPTEILAAQVAGPQGGLASDAVYPSFPGTTVYAATLSNVTRITNILSASNMTVNLNYGGNFPTIFGIYADPLDPQNATVYIGADPTGGGINGSGQIWKVSPTPCAAAAPLAPVVTSALAGPGSNQATVNWAPTVSCNPATSYTVKTLVASATGGAPTASTIPNVTVAAPALTAVISGLTAGAPGYQFEVQACNATGCSAFSAASSVVIPFVATAPPAPTNVIGVDSGNGVSAAVAWTQSGNGNSTITSSTIKTNAPAGAPLVPNTVVLGAATGGTVTGLTCGNSYTFQVSATNAIGTSPLSTASLPVSIACVTAADVSVTESVQATANPGAIVPFTITIHNGGPAAAASVAFSETLPAPLFSSSSTQGICAGTQGLTSFNCNLGSLAAGATATVTVSVTLPSVPSGSFTNTLTVNATNASGVNVDPILSNNTASATVSISGGCSATSTDIQVGGAAQNGNPVHGTPDVFTWQIKNNLGTTPANCVLFSASTTAPTGAVLSVSATNPGASATAPSCTFTSTTVTCNLGNIAGGSSATVTVTATPSAAAPANSYSMQGSASFTGTDTNPANNSFTVFIGAQ